MRIFIYIGTFYIYVCVYFCINSILVHYFSFKICLKKQNGILILQKDIPFKGHLRVGCQDRYCCHVLLVCDFYIAI